MISLYIYITIDKYVKIHIRKFFIECLYNLGIIILNLIFKLFKKFLFSPSLVKFSPFPTLSQILVFSLGANILLYIYTFYIN